MLLFELQRGDKWTKQINYQQGFGATAVYTKKMTESTKGIGNKYIKKMMKYCFLFDSWLSSKKVAETTMKVGVKLIGMSKKNTKGFCKETI